LAIAKYFLAIVICLSLISAIPSVAGASTVTIDRFNGDVANATLTFNNSLVNSTLSIDIPPGALLTKAEMVVEGVGVNGSPSSVLDFANGIVGTNVFAFWNEGQGLYPPSVDPRNHRWSKIGNNEVSSIQYVDDDLWETRTTGQGLPPYEYPVQLYRFIPVSAGATAMEVMWHGSGQNALNLTTPFWADLWLYNHTDKEWIRVANFTSNESKTGWLNYTFDLPSPFIGTDGSVDVAVAGPHSESNLLLNPGQLFTDYIGIEVTSVGAVQYPRDVKLSIDGVDIFTLADNVTDPRIIHDAYGLKEGLQQILDEYPVDPNNVTLTLDFSVRMPTAGWLTVRDLLIEYEPIVNEAPVYIGPDGVELDEDSDWTPVLDLDAAFYDDYNTLALVFELIEIEWPDTPLALFRLGTAVDGNRTLEVKPAPDYFGTIPFEYSVKATDLFGLETIGRLNITVLQKADRPSLEEIVYLEAYERSPFSHFVDVTDPDLPDDTLVFTDDSPYLDIDQDTGEIVWTPSADQIGEHTFLVTVTDRFGLYDRTQLTITVINSNDPPIIVSDLEMNGKQGEEASYIVRAVDPDVPFGDVLQYFAFADAIAFDIDPDTGRITFTPSNDHVPSFEIVIRVQDKIGELDERVLVVYVENVNDPPEFDEIGTITRDQNAPVIYQLKATDPDLGRALPQAETITFSGVGPEVLLPDTDGVVSFTADQSMVGEHQATYTVTDRAGLSDVVTVTWVIVDVNDVPTIITDVDPTEEALEDAQFILTLEAADPDNDPITWSDDTDLFDIGESDGIINFTPLQADVGIYTVTVIASDDVGGETWLTFDLMVTNVNDDPVLGQVGPKSGSSFEDGETIEFSASATDEDGDTLQYVWKKGNEVIGTGPLFTYDGLGPGEHTVTLEVSDLNGGLATQKIKVEVTSSFLSAMLLPLALLIAIIVVVGVVLFMRSRSRVDETKGEAPAEEEPPVEPVEKVSYDLDSSVALDYETLDAPITPTEETVKDSLDEDELYKLEEAEEFRVGETGNGNEEPPEE
jgi:hypothetical protein